MKGFTQQTELRFRATNARFHNAPSVKLLRKSHVTSSMNQGMGPQIS